MYTRTAHYTLVDSIYLQDDVTLHKHLALTIINYVFKYMRDYEMLNLN